jgi:hypothetical protein
MQASVPVRAELAFGGRKQRFCCFTGRMNFVEKMDVLVVDLCRKKSTAKRVRFNVNVPLILFHICFPRIDFQLINFKFFFEDATGTTRFEVGTTTRARERPGWQQTSRKTKPCKRTFEILAMSHTHVN